LSSVTRYSSQTKTLVHASVFFVIIYFLSRLLLVKRVTYSTVIKPKQEIQNEDDACDDDDGGDGCFRFDG
jgi:hypothetical protein